MVKLFLYVLRLINFFQRISIDFYVFGLKTYLGQVIVNSDTLIPILVYQGQSIVLFQQCGFYDIAHVNRKKLYVWDFFP